MSSNTFLIFLVIFNLLAIHYAYRIDSSGEPTQGLLHTYEENANDDGRSINLYNLKPTEDYNPDTNYLIPCHAVSSSSSYILCKKLDQLSRRDTGFLRFGRKR